MAGEAAMFPRERLRALVQLLPLAICDCANRDVSFATSMMASGAGWYEPVTADEAFAMRELTVTDMIELLKKGR